MRRSPAFFCLWLLGGGATRAHAFGICTVDPTGTSGIAGAFATVNAALTAGGCDLPGSSISVWCPLAGCSDSAVQIVGLSDLTITSLESATAGPVSLVELAGQPAVTITGSTNIRLEGISSYTGGPAPAVSITDSTATLVGPIGTVVPRYAAVTGTTGISVLGASVVTLQGVGFSDSQTGLRVAASANGSPAVYATGVAFQHNALAGLITGQSGDCLAPLDTILDIRSDGALAWSNYVMDNVEGFQVRGRALLAMDHTILASNLTQMAAGGRNPLLLQIHDSSRLEARNVTIYDNDSRPGLSGPFGAGGANTAGYILEHNSCDESIFQASSVINNACDITFGVGGAGRVTLDHTVVAGNWGKTLSMSGYYVSHGNTCPPLQMTAAYFWGNSLAADPAACLPPAPGLRQNWDPMPVITPTIPRTLVAYPDLPTPWTDIYLIRRKQPIKYALPVGLYAGRAWSVNGVHDDTKRLDVGYHNPQ